MYIERIEMDGFKSYAQRTSVVAFDAQFNAITGSGKSNIFDAICFVLGMTCSRRCPVRAKQMHDLVYKQGQAGVNKANVNIVFNNTDAEKSPLGYHDCNEITVRREIVVGGKSKFWINGSVAKSSRVADLFRSVQLNVNKPHFLIMRGHITKVLNMKPREVLSMIEEAAGTKMYDTKKRQALSTIVKKQKRLDDINAVCPAATTAVAHAPAVQMLKDEIGPEVEKLRKDRAKYLEYQKLQGKLPALKKLYVAFRYHTLEEASKLRRDELDAELARLEELLGKNKRRLAELDAQMERIKAQCAVEKGEQLARIEKSLQDAKKVKAQLDSALNAARADKKDKDKQMATKDSELAKVRAACVVQVVWKCVFACSDRGGLGGAARRAEAHSGDGGRGAIETMGKELDAALKKAQARLQAIAQGLVEDDQGKLRTLTGQKKDLFAQASTLSTATKTGRLRDLEHELDAEEVARLEAEMADLAEKEKNAEEYRKSEERDAKKQVAEASKAVDVFKREYEKSAEKLRVIRATIEGLVTDTHADEAVVREVRAQMDAQMDGIEAKIGKATEDADKAAADVAEIEARLTEPLECVQRQEAQLQAREDERRQVDEEMRAADLTLNERKAERAKTDTELTKYKKFVKKLKRKNDWIESEKFVFGKREPFNERKKLLKKMRRRHEKLASQINAAAVNMLAEAEKQEIELDAKKAQVEADKTQLEESIRDLDEKKNKQIVEAYGKINKDFGSIFSMLLPGAQARLKPPAGKTPLDGRQRSLVALSLVLAMRKFRPAPIYILDEIDEGLDLSHTQNIGQMIQTHFGSSQFIVVLKDGLFNNANVLFETRFDDGCSTVSRHDNPRSSNKENVRR